MNYSTQHDIASLVAVATSVPPQSSSGGTIQGNSIDRQAHGLPLSCLLHQTIGADSGAPTALTVQTTLQHSPDNAVWSNYLADGFSPAQTTPLAAADTENGAAIDLHGAWRYVRAVTAVSFTGGASPSVLVCADIIFGGEVALPAM